MLILLSPAKSLDFSPSPTPLFTEPEWLDESDKLIKTLRNKSEKSIAELMNLSPNLAKLNKARYADYDRTLSLDAGAKQSLLAFNGDVYRDWPFEEYSSPDFEYAQSHLRILSGLYGALRPLDLILPHRLEMGTALKTRRGKNLYQFWGSRITQSLNNALAEQKSDLVVNLASNEYFASVETKKLKAQVVSPVFKDFKNGKYKIISFFAKKARGQMAHFLIKERLSTLEGLLSFDHNGYQYDAESSTRQAPVFLRKQ